MSLPRGRILHIVVIALALGGALASIEIARAPSTEERQQRTRDVLQEVEEENIAGIQVSTGKKEELYSLERATDASVDSYRITSALLPAETQAAEVDPAEMRQFLNALLAMQWDSRKNQKPILEPSVRPEFSLLFRVNDTKYQLHLFRKPNPAQSDPSIWAQLWKNEDFQASGKVRGFELEQFPADPRSFFGPLLAPWPKRKVEKLELSSDRGVVGLQATPSGFVLSNGQRAARAPVNLLFEQMARMDLEKLTPWIKTASSVNADPHHVALQVLTSNGQNHHLKIGGKCPDDSQRILAFEEESPRRSGCLKRELFSAFHQDAERFIDKSLAPLNFDEIDHVVLTNESWRFDLIRDGQRFQLLSPRQESVELSVGNAWLEKLSSSKARILASPSPALQAWLAKPENQWAELTISPSVSIRKDSEAGAKFQMTLFFPTDSGERFARRQSDGALLALSPEQIQLLDPDATWARSKMVYQAKEQNIVALQLKTKDGLQKLKKSEGRWFFEGTPGIAPLPDPQQIEKLLHQLEHLQAERWVKPSEARFMDPRLRLRFIENQGGEKSEHELLVAGRVYGGHLSRFDQQEAVFVLSDGLYRLLQLSLMNRGPYTSLKQAAEEIIISAHFQDRGLRRPSESIRLTKKDGFWENDRLELSEEWTQGAYESWLGCSPFEVTKALSSSEFGPLQIQVTLLSLKDSTSDPSSSSKPRLDNSKSSKIVYSYGKPRLRRGEVVVPLRRDDQVGTAWIYAENFERFRQFF
ncbi:MAG: hypothetical protein MK135_03995 [Polyangiaceae bacterium]|nr:hypothetical protein [Polyangiaceae bacterium]